jgi:UDP:flavonoid glycosyltransferase YjiC (YdhE family)
MIDRAVGPQLNAFRAELGLAPIKKIMNLWWHSPQKIIGLFPEWFAPPQPDWPPNTLLTGFPLWDESGVTESPLGLEAFLAAGTAPIVFTPGSAMIHGHEFFAAAVDACQRLGRRGLLLTRYPEQLPKSLPESVKHFDFIPLSQVLPRSAALVCHGGVGTVAQGLAAGIPQLIMPMSHDQPDNAARLARLGVGSSLSPRRFRGPAVARELDKLLNSPEVARRCRELATRFDTPAALRATCDAIESVAKQGAASRAGV